MIEVSAELVLSRAHIPGSKIDDELVFFNQENGKYYGTGPVGAEIWDVLEVPKSFAEICDHLLEKYDVSRDDCERDVGNFVRDMLAGGILETRG